MQMSGGHLLAAGLDGGNTMIKSSPVTGTRKDRDCDTITVFSTKSTLGVGEIIFDDKILPSVG